MKMLKGSPSHYLYRWNWCCWAPTWCGLGGGNDEREQTLNQLLIEMDGLEGSEGIIVTAILTVLMFLTLPFFVLAVLTVKFLVGRPDVKGREAIVFMLRTNHSLQMWTWNWLLNKHQDLSVLISKMFWTKQPWLQLVEIKSNWCCWYRWSRRSCYCRSI